MDNLKIMVGMPVYDNKLYLPVANKIMELKDYLAARDVGMIWAATCSTYIESGRNIIADTFMQSDCTHLIFIDSDILFEPYHVWQLLEADQEVVAGLYPVKQIYWEGVKTVAPHLPHQMLGHVHGRSLFYAIDRDEANYKLPNPHELAEVTGAATGFMCIKRSAMELWHNTYGHLKEYTLEENEMILTKYFGLGWVEMDGKSQYCGDDIWFCHLYRKAGGRIFVVPTISLGHIGMHTYGGCTWCSQGQVIHGYTEDEKGIKYARQKSPKIPDKV